MTQIMYEIREVFTPTTPARVAFVDREKINTKLVNALRTPGKQIVVYGHSGSGKTTLLVNKLHQLYEVHVTTRCMRGLTFDQLVLDAFDQLAPFFVSERSSAEKRTVTAELSATYLAIQTKLTSSAVQETGERTTRVLPPQLSPQNLGRFFGAAACCWVLEDFHKMGDDEKGRLAQLMKVFMDMSDEYPYLKIIALGAVDTARQVVDYDPEMKNRVAEIRVHLMEPREIREIIDKGEKALNIAFGEKLKSSITDYSNGLASVCHHLCLNLCDAAGIERTMAHQCSIPQSTFKGRVETLCRGGVRQHKERVRQGFEEGAKNKIRKRREHSACPV